MAIIYFVFYKSQQLAKSCTIYYTIIKRPVLSTKLNAFLYTEAIDFSDKLQKISWQLPLSKNLLSEL